MLAYQMNIQYAANEHTVCCILNNDNFSSTTVSMLALILTNVKIQFILEKEAFQGVCQLPAKNFGFSYRLVSHVFYLHDVSRL